MSAQPISAAQAVGEVLQSPDDLLKIAAFRKRLEKEKASIDARLKVGIKEQLESTREALRKLLNSRGDVQAMKDELFAIDTECRELQGAVPVFDQISRVSIVHRNFQQTREMVTNLRDLQPKLEGLKTMLLADRDDITGPARNLLPLHYHLSQLQSFRSQTLHMAKKSTPESKAALNRIFEPLNRFIDEFDEYYSTLCRNVLPIIRAGYPEVVVKLVKIAEIEGKEDEKAIAIRLVRKAAKIDAASKFKSIQADARVLKHYRSKMIKCITESISGAFDEAYKRDDPNGFLENISWMYRDILKIEEEVVACFPKEWEIYSLYIREYHKALNSTIKRYLDTEPQASFFLTLSTWLKQYKKDMAELNIPPDLLEPPLLDGKEQALIDDYLKLIINKLDEWSANLMKTEVQQFTSRTEPPEVDSDGFYGLQGSVILFQMVNQQVDLGVDSNQGAILTRVVTESSRVMRNIQDTWVKLIDSEYKKQVDKPEETPGGLGEYCIALANDQIKCADFAETLSGRLEPLVSEKYKVIISERLNEAIDGYLDVAKRCTQILIDLVFNDLRPATKQLFQAAWYEGNMRQIVETMRDYMTDYQAYLNPSIFELLVEDLLDAFLVSYLTALANAGKLKMPDAVNRIREDIRLAYQFFGALKPPDEVKQNFEVIDMVLSLLEASKSLAFLSFWSFAKVHGPNISFVENIIRSRDDFDRSAANEVMESIKRKVKEEGLSDPPEPTIMKKITIQTLISRFLRT